MFIDYSGLSRFQSINTEFVNRCIKLYKFQHLTTHAAKLNMVKAELLEIGKPNDACRSLNDVELEQLFCLSISIDQMKQVFDVVKRCPTVYVVEPQCLSSIKFKMYYNNFQVGLSKQITDFRKEYRDLRIELYELIKVLIITLKPSLEEIQKYHEWNYLQKMLFYNYSRKDLENIPKFSNIKVCQQLSHRNLILSDEFKKMVKDFYIYKFKIVYSECKLYENISKENVLLETLRHDINICIKGSKGSHSVIKTKNKCKSERKTPGFLELFNDRVSNNSNSKITTKEYIKDTNDMYNSICCGQNSESDMEILKENYDFEQERKSVKSELTINEIFSPLNTIDLPPVLTENNRNGYNYNNKNNHDVQPLGEHYLNKITYPLPQSSISPAYDLKSTTRTNPEYSSIFSKSPPFQREVLPFQDNHFENKISRSDSITKQNMQPIADSNIKSLDELTFREFIAYKFRKTRFSKKKPPKLFYHSSKI